MYPIQRTTIFAKSLLSAAESGIVHSVYRKTINLRLGSSLLALQAKASPLSPISLITTLTEREMSALPISAGQPVRLQEGEIYIPEAGLVFSLNTAETVETHLAPAQECSIPSLTGAICSVLKHSSKSGFLRLFFPQETSGQLDELLVLSAAQKYLDTCTQNVLLFHYTTAAFSLSRLIGLGIGLTPSGDDFLCGVLAGFILRGISDHPFSVEVRKQIQQKLSETNDISRAFLQCALLGQFSEAVCSLAHSSDPAQISAAFHAIGHSSGMDTLCGILYTLTLSLPG
ncbi:MAG: DUF2877 domain-containing protein [Clostridia bacterium]|nr:DUF2877 domain-containing protein [Clostridia bacterium]